MSRQRGLTIIKLMFLLAVAGVIGWFVVDELVAMRCRDDPAPAMCAGRAH